LLTTAVDVWLIARLTRRRVLCWSIGGASHTREVVHVKAGKALTLICCDLSGRGGSTDVHVGGGLTEDVCTWGISVWTHLLEHGLLSTGEVGRRTAHPA
jgi:hypothetical protein